MTIRPIILPITEAQSKQLIVGDWVYPGVSDSRYQIVRIEGDDFVIRRKSDYYETYRKWYQLDAKQFNGCLVRNGELLPDTRIIRSF